MYSLVKDFFYNLYDMDFLSMLDNADFYTKKVSMKKFYWQKLYQIISSFVELRNKHERDALARAMKELTYWRLGMVSSTSFKKYFMRKYHSNRDNILDRLYNLRSSLRSFISSPIKHKQIKKKNKSKKDKQAPAQHYVENTPVSDFIKSNPHYEYLLNEIEKKYHGEIIFNEEKAERSAYYPPSVEGSLGLIEFDELNDEKFIHELAHLLYDCNDFANYGLARDEEYHDDIFWEIVKTINQGYEYGDFTYILDVISNIRPWSIETNLPPLEEKVIDRVLTPEFEEKDSDFQVPLNFENPSGAIFGPEGPKIYEMGYENYREPFGYTEPPPVNNRGRSRSPGFRTRRVNK